MFKRLLAALFALLVLSGCYDNIDINKRGLVTAIGIDVAPTTGVLVTAQIPNISNAEEALMLTARGKTLAEAFANLKGTTNLAITYDFTRVVCFSTDVLNSRETLTDALNTLRNRENISARAMALAVTGTASELFNECYTHDIGVYVSDYYRANRNSLTETVEIDLGDIYDKFGVAPLVLPLASAKNGYVSLNGAAVENRKRFGSTISADVVKGFLILTNGGFGGAITVTSPDKTASFAINSIHSDYGVSLKNGRPFCVANIKAIVSNSGLTGGDQALFASLIKKELCRMADQAFAEFARVNEPALGIKDAFAADRLPADFDLSDVNFTSAATVKFK